MNSTHNIFDYEEFRRFSAKYNLSRLLSDGVTMAEFMIMQQIDFETDEKSDKYVTVSELVSMAPITAQAISKTLSKMEKKGYVHRFTNVNDRRVTNVVLCGKGKKIFAVQKNRIISLRNYMYDRLSNEELEQIRDLTEKLRALYIEGMEKILSEQIFEK